MAASNQSDAVVVPLTAARINAAIACAREVWPAAYEPILPPGQVDYMLGERTDPSRLAAYLSATDAWYDLAVPGGEEAASESDTVLGYTSCRLADPHRVRLEQLYVVPGRWGTGLADLLLSTVLGHASDAGVETVDLTVNRNNARALAYYRRHGFVVSGEVVADIGGGFVMDDFVLVRPLVL